MFIPSSFHASLIAHYKLLAQLTPEVIRSDYRTIVSKELHLKSISHRTLTRYTHTHSPSPPIGLYVRKYMRIHTYVTLVASKVNV